MRIHYTDHARQRMHQRKIGENDVKDTLEAPDELLVGDFGEEIAIKSFGTFQVRVI